MLKTQKFREAWRETKKKIKGSYLSKIKMEVSRMRILPPKISNFWLISILIFLIFAILTLGGMTYIQYQLNYPLQAHQNYQDFRIFVVTPGETIKEIAYNLEKQELIRNDFWFLFYVWQLQKREKQPITIKAGKYRLSSRLSVVQIAQILIKGQQEPTEIQVLIPEGYNIFQIDKTLTAKGLIKEGELLEVDQTIKEKAQQGKCLEGFPLEYCLLVKQGLRTGLEGYLFPDTYRLKEGDPAKKIVQKLLGNFFKKVMPLFAQESFEKIPETIIKASLLEKEVKTFKEKQIVAGILDKRLEANMPLQVDATLLYAQILEQGRADDGIQKHNPVNIAHTQIDSPYNTYLNKGLPPGPICNPGLSSIKAALNPIKTDYWYYLNTKEGKTIYSKTYQEHLRNKEKYLNNN